ncbi:MAG: hypothetical protein LUB59_02580 [Candidatus Gastranaerophilales bacterium]|nr:hypothetical protein [Candidatus Gastranaerophilales bacterium]
MNNINFTGIQNIKICKKHYSENGLYLGLDNKLKQGAKDMTEVKLSAKLTNDEKGNDLDDYRRRLPNKNFFDPENSDTVELHLKRADMKEDMISQSTFNLNGKPLIIDNDKKLPILTFFARLTRESAQNPEMSEGKKEYLKLINESIHKEAVDFIENR